MRALSHDAFNQLITAVGIKSRVQSELKFVKSIEAMQSEWSTYELIAVHDRTGDKGVLLLEPGNDLYIVQYEVSRRIVDYATGRRRAIICDFCYTWQPGSNAASILFTSSHTKSKIGFLCCADLQCSQHVRSMTKSSAVSRTQLRENMTSEDRIYRLKNRLVSKIEQLKLQPVATINLKI